MLLLGYGALAFVTVAFSGQEVAKYIVSSPGIFL